jgi:serine/threonine protein kinase
MYLTAIIGFAALAKVQLGLWGFYYRSEALTPVLVATTVVFALAGCFLIFAGRNSSQSRLLGVAFLLTASGFSDPQVLRLQNQVSTLSSFPFSLVAHFHFSSFIAAYTWMFVREFPQKPKSTNLNRTLQWVIRLCVFWGSILFLANDLGIALSLALESFHSKRMIHRDIKPSNIGFTGAGNPKLLDLGLAKVLGDCPDLQTVSLQQTCVPQSSALTWIASPNSSYIIVGTPAYLPPEALLGVNSQPSLDLWGLAISLYEALSGRNPMAGPTLAETLELVRRARVPDIREFVSVPSQVAEFFKKCTSENRATRPQTARQFRFLLDEVKSATAQA